MKCFNGGVSICILSFLFIFCQQGNDGKNADIRPDKDVITFDQFMGINSFVDDPIDKMQAVGFIREYHNWNWDEGDGKADYSGYPNNALKWAPSEAANGGWNFDGFYTQIKQAGLLIAPCLQGSVPWLQPDIAFRHSAKPVDKPGFPADDPQSYHAKAHYMYQFAARYGSRKVDTETLTLATGQPANSGMDLVHYVEDWNEQDKNWEGPDAQFTPQEYAAMLSANYDGHENTLKGGNGTFGVKNADPHIKLVMGGLAHPSLAYIAAMKKWFEKNRSDKKFTADVINVHYYAWKDGKSWQGGGPALSPEAANFKGFMHKFVQYRDKYLPGTEVWISEFGWDTQPQSVLSPPAVGSFDIHEVQAQWLVRAYLAFAAAGVDRAQQFMLRDSDPNASDWFASCGIVGPKGSWTPKTSWYYIYTLKNTLKNMRYLGEEATVDPDLLIYKFKDIHSDKGAYVVWAKTQKNYSISQYALKLPATVKSARLVTMVRGSTTGKTNSLTINNSQVRADISERPVFILVDRIR